MNKTVKSNQGDPSVNDETVVTRKIRVTRGLLIAVLSFFFIAIVVTSASIRFIYHMYQTLPSPEQLGNIEPSLVSRVYAADSTLVHEFSVERRFWVDFKHIPVNLQRAVIAIEDRKFYDHWGIDLRRIVGSVVANVISLSKSQGGSTLTQQLARNVYLTAKKDYTRKIREILTSIQIESYYTKDEIMELYLNTIYLGAGVYGVETAAQTYFGKTVSELTLNECAILAGCIQLPEKYRPDKADNNKRTLARKNTVLRAMNKVGFISRTELSEAVNEPIPTRPKSTKTYHAQYFVEYVRQYLEKKYGENLLYNGGLSIYTTLNLAAQDSADAAIRLHLDSLQQITNGMFLDSTRADKMLNVSREYFLAHFDSLYEAHQDTFSRIGDSVKLRIIQTSVLAMDVKTGAIVTMSGGRDFSESKFNRVTQALRQPGSSFKPFVYATALMNGYTPATVENDQPITLETPEGLWRPENYEKEFYGPVTLRTALKKSINLVAIQIMMDVGADKVIALARSAGLSHTLDPVPSLAIGSCEVTNYEMVNAYTMFPGEGYEPDPYFIEKVIDKNGRVLENHVPSGKQVLDPKIAYLTTSLMTSVVRGGTASSVVARGFTRPAAGKTGTTNNYSDAWFIGFTPQIVCGVWTGIDERRSMGRGVTGSKGAIPIWVKTMSALHRKLPVRDFTMPDEIVSMRICAKSNKVATSFCSEYYDELFMADQTPLECDIHGIGAGKSNNMMEKFGSEPSDNKKKKKKLIF